MEKRKLKVLLMQLGELYLQNFGEVSWEELGREFTENWEFGLMPLFQSRYLTEIGWVCVMI